MFGFNHPRPVRDPRPVAELSVNLPAPRRVPEVMQGPPQAVAAPLANPGNRCDAAAAGPEVEAIHIEVRYRFSEWRAFVWAHVSSQLAPADAPGRRPKRLGLGTRALMWPVLIAAFACKRISMPVCRFAIDEAGVMRHAGGVSSRYDWPQFSAVHTYPPGLLLALPHGGMPLPRRCLDAAQWAQVCRWADAHGLRLPTASAPTHLRGGPGN